jgi:hypothetical protein
MKIYQCVSCLVILTRYSSIDNILTPYGLKPRTFRGPTLLIEIIYIYIVNI